jgi:hypothetical protein
MEDELVQQRSMVCYCRYFSVIHTNLHHHIGCA